MGIIQCCLFLLGLSSVQAQTEAPEENLARGGIASQSTTVKAADLAIDGGKDFTVNSPVCAATMWEAIPWFKLDLRAAYRVSSVVVTYREDSFPTEVHLGNSLFDYTRCTIITRDQTNRTIYCSCGDREGRYVTIWGWWNVLSVCEVEVYESDAPPLSTANVVMQSFLKVAFNTIADLTDPRVTERVLEELKSVLEVRGLTNVTLSWSQTPEEETEVMEKQFENDSC